MRLCFSKKSIARLIIEDNSIVTIAFPEKTFHAILLPSAEKKQSSFIKRIKLEYTLNLLCKTINAESEVRIPACKINLLISRWVLKHGMPP